MSSLSEQSEQLSTDDRLALLEAEFDKQISDVSAWLVKLEDLLARVLTRMGLTKVDHRVSR